MILCRPHQREMPLMKVPHGGHQGKGLSLHTNPIGSLLHVINGFYNFHGKRFPPAVFSNDFEAELYLVSSVYPVVNCQGGRQPQKIRHIEHFRPFSRIYATCRQGG